MSTSSSASPLPRPSGSMSLRTPVEVSACTTAMIAGDGWAASRRSGSIGSPHAASTRTTSAPRRAATSHIRSPKTPLTPTTTGSPGRTKFTNDASMPADPVPLTGSVSAFDVREDLAQAVVRAVEQRQELRIEVAEHGSGQRHGDFRVRIRRPRPHEQAVGYPHRRIVAGPRSPAPTRRLAHPVSGRLPAWNGCSSPPGSSRPCLPTSPRIPVAYATWVARTRGRPPAIAHSDAGHRGPRARHAGRRCTTRRPIRRTLEALHAQTSGRWSLTVVAAEDQARRGRRSSCGPSHVPAAPPARPVGRRRRGDDARQRAPPGRASRPHRGANVALIFPGDVWAPDAVALLSAALTPTGVVYADEDEPAPDGTHAAPRLKPDFSPEFLLSSAYVGRPLAIGAGLTGAPAPPRRRRVPPSSSTSAPWPPCEAADVGDPHRRGAVPPFGRRAPGRRRRDVAPRAGGAAPPERARRR